MSRSTSEAETPWERTLTAADEMATELREDGWEVAVVRAGHVAPVPPDAEGSFGLVYVAPDAAAESVPSVVERSHLDRYEVFRRRAGRDLYLLTREVDPGAGRAVLLVGALDLGRADAMVEAARRRGELPAHVRTLDGTRLATFRHDDPEPFLPE